jgi:hypothetical protein
VKILYGIGKRVGAGIQASRILNNISNHEVRFIGSNISFPYLKFVHWNVDSLTRMNKLENIPKYERLIDDIAIWNPDLIISDAEEISAKISKILNIPLWYCSPLHLEDGLEWAKGSKIISDILIQDRAFLLNLPIANKIFIYSPFCSFNITPKCGYEWVKPYYNICSETKDYNLAVIPDKNRFIVLRKVFNKVKQEVLYCSPDYSHSYSDKISECGGVMFLTGETSYIADCIYNNKYMYMMPDNKDFETILNSIMVKNYKLGENLNQVELLEDIAPKKISKILQDKKTIFNIYSDSTKYLHEIIEEYQQSREAVEI